MKINPRNQSNKICNPSVADAFGTIIIPRKTVQKSIKVSSVNLSPTRVHSGIFRKKVLNRCRQSSVKFGSSLYEVRNCLPLASQIDGAINRLEILLRNLLDVCVKSTELGYRSNLVTSYSLSTGGKGLSKSLTRTKVTWLASFTHFLTARDILTAFLALSYIFF